MSTTLKGLVGLLFVFVPVDSAQGSPVLFYEAPDGSRYTLDASNIGALYTFELVADFSGVTDSSALGDYAMLISFKPVGATWSVGSIFAAPGSESNWEIVQTIPTPTGASPEWTSGSGASASCRTEHRTARSSTRAASCPGSTP